MAKRANDNSDEEDQLREQKDHDQEDFEDGSEEDVKPKKKAAPKKKVEPNFKGKGKKEVEEKKKVAKKPRTSGEGSSKGSKVQVETNEDGDGYIELGNHKRVTVREYKGVTLVDIREYYTDKSGDEKPGKKGISLNAAQFQQLSESIGLIEGLL